MDIGVLGTGVVGKTIASSLVNAGYRVRMGSRTAANPKAIEWVLGAGPDASEGSFANAARFGEILFNCTAGAVSLQALAQCGEEALRGKVLVDVSNPLDFSRGMPPTLTVCNTDSLGEQIQNAYPETRVVKALNTINCEVMVDPGMLGGDHQVFLCGNHPGAKAETMELLTRAFGWRRENLIDLGDISSARGAEMFVVLWLRLMGTLGTPHFSLRLVTPTLRADAATPLPMPEPA